MSEQAKIYVGTSGWSYPRGEGSWKSHFYPSGKVNELEYYSRFFNTVEINSSFYRPFSAASAVSWTRTVPEDFLFSVKLWQKFTHPGMYKQATGEEAVISRDDVDVFIRSIEPLAISGKLGILLAQFPPSFKNDGYGRQILNAVMRTFGDYRLAIELRHRSWSDDEGTSAVLSAGNVCWVNIDEPRFPTSVAAEVPLTSDMAYFRFHGRNREMWWQGDSETRYKYLYSAEEIGELTGRVKAAAGQVRLLFAFFNNHWQAYAPRNANDLKKALGTPVRELTMQDSPPDAGTQGQFLL